MPSNQADRGSDDSLDPTPRSVLQRASFALGNAPRTLPHTRGPGNFNLDLSLIKNTPLNEHITLQVRFADPSLQHAAVRATQHRAPQRPVRPHHRHPVAAPPGTNSR